MHLFAETGFQGVHVGQTDRSIREVRRFAGREAIVGLSTHNPQQLRDADTQDITYAAMGPLFATTTKVNPDPVVGLEAVRRARKLTQKPLVAIGGITRENAPEVLATGVDYVSVVTGLLPPAGASLSKLAKTVRDFLRAIE